MLVVFLVSPEGTSGRGSTRLQPDLTLCHCIITSLHLWVGRVDAAAPPEAPPPQCRRCRGTDHLFTSSQQEGWHREAGAAEAGLSAPSMASRSLFCVVRALADWQQVEGGRFPVSPTLCPQWSPIKEGNQKKNKKAAWHHLFWLCLPWRFLSLSPGLLPLPSAPVRMR